MKISTSILLMILMLFSCSESSVNPEKIKLKFYKDASLIHGGLPIFVLPGDAMVFHYFHRAEDQPNIADDEFAEDFLFELGNGIVGFDYEGETLRMLPHVYRAHCFRCDSRQANELSVLAGHWH